MGGGRMEKSIFSGCCSDLRSTVALELNRTEGILFPNLSVGKWQTDFTEVGPPVRVCVNGSALMDAVRLCVDSV